MRPIQLWLPAFKCDVEEPASRREAVREMLLRWWGHDHVWWLPDLEAQRSWQDARGSHLAIPSDQLERLAVIHVGANGYACGRGALSVFPQKTVGTLLDDWLHLDTREFARPVCPPDSIEGDLPQFADDGTVSYAPVGVKLGLAPAAESKDLLQWTGSLAPLFPPVTDHLPLLHWSWMRQIAEEAGEDLDRAIRRAAVFAGAYLREGYSTPELAWFFPTVLERGQSDGLRWVIDAIARRKLPVDDAFRRQFSHYGLRDGAAIDAVLGSSSWRHFLRQQIPVRRAWGAIGLFWALLIDRLEGGRVGPGACERCGAVVVGKAGKQFCGPEDNPECFRERRAQDQRRSRRHRREVDRQVS